MENHLHPSAEKFTAGTNIPVWVNSIEPIAYSMLELNKEVDVVIVGGGLAGVSIAYNLTKAGKQVALVEDGFIGSGETGRTTAHLVTALDDRYYEFERLFGAEDTRLIAQSHASAIDFIERTVGAEKIDCAFERVNGYLFLHPSDKAENLERELEAAKRSGLAVELSSIMLGQKDYKAIKFSNQAQFHPLKYVKGLCDAIIKNGGNIYTNTHAKTIDASGIVSNEGFRITAQYVVVATNSPVNNKYAMHLKQYPYRTYVIGAKIKKDSLPHALWWDTGDFGANANIIGHNPRDEKNVFIVTGDSGNGMTHGTIAGLLIKDLITGKENKFEKIYNPSRITLKSANVFLKEFIGGFFGYLKTKPGKENEASLQTLGKNEGRIFEFNGKKFGAYRDEQDHLHFVDSECTHLGCMVKWNNDEKSWDCPCHGSRFTYEGHVLNGPANQPLAYYSQQMELTDINKKTA